MKIADPPVDASRVVGRAYPMWASPVRRGFQGRNQRMRWGEQADAAVRAIARDTGASAHPGQLARLAGLGVYPIAADDTFNSWLFVVVAPSRARRPMLRRLAAFGTVTAVVSPGSRMSTTDLAEYDLLDVSVVRWNGESTASLLAPLTHEREQRGGSEAWVRTVHTALRRHVASLPL
jgi:hypothetical protein